MKIMNLRVENRIEPLGVDQEKPIFSWNVETKEQGWKQKAYEIWIWEASQQEWRQKEDGDRKPEPKLEAGTACEADRKVCWYSGEVSGRMMVNIPYGGEALKPQTAYCWKVRVHSESGGEAESAVAFFETGMLGHHELWQGKWIGETEKREHHLYRKSFTASKEIAKARAYICGLGHFILYANGKQVEDYVLEPGWTTYEKSCLYAVYDMTPYLRQGDNGLGIMLGNGMYHIPKTDGRYSYFPRSYGFSKALLQLHITYADGSNETIVSDESWKRAESPLAFCCIYGGEEFHGEKFPKGFSKGDFDDAAWEAAEIVEAPKGTLVSQQTQPIKVMEKYAPVSVTEVKPGVYMYDLGKNFSGWVRIRVKKNEAEPGMRIKLKPGEILKEDGTPDQKVTGKNYSWDYYLDGEEEQEYAPHFTFTGFRYVQMEGAVPVELAVPGETRPVITSLVGEFLYPDMELMGEFTCSEPLFNQIHGIITQAIKSNIKSVFTDCPHREKLGWLEQTHLIGPAILFNYDVHNLYEKVEKDMMEAQHENGLVPDICPEYITGFGKYHEGFVDSPEWGSACIINPWYLYRKYGDTAIFARYYDTMRTYLKHLTDMSHRYLLHHGLGDWLDIGPCVPYSQNTPVTVVATCVYYYDLRIMKQVAEILGKKEDAAEYEDLMAHVKEEYTTLFFDRQANRFANGSQAAQAMSLVAGLVEKEYEEAVMEQLVRDIRGRDNATTAGDIGHPFVMAALTMYGRSDVIFDMMMETKRPGYGYQVKCGATTLTEEWDGPDPARPHGSQNHFMLGSGEEWFYSGLAGIQGLRQNRSFDDILIKPFFPEKLQEVKAWHKHPYGRMSVEWKWKNDTSVSINVTLPPNTSGTLVSPWGDRTEELESGTYEFVLEKPVESEK